MPSIDVPIEILRGADASGEVVLSVDFEYRPGSPAHMGSLTFPGDPGDPPEVEIERIFWPITRWDREKRENVADHIEMPWSGLPNSVVDAVEVFIIENYNEPDWPDYDEEYDR